MRNNKLSFSNQNAMIYDATMRMQIEDMINKKFLNQHQSKIWQGNNGSWYTYLLDEKGKRKLIRKSTREGLNKAIIAYYKGTSKTFGQMFYEWLVYKEDYDKIKRQSIDRYEITYNKYFNALAKEIFVNITPQQVEMFVRNTIRDNDLTAKQWGDVRIILRGVFSYGKYDTTFSISHLLDDMNLSPKVFRKRIKDDSAEVFTNDEEKAIERFIQENPDIRSYGVLLGLRLGLRIGEIATLKYSDIDKDILHVHRTEIRVKENGITTFKIQDFTKGAVGHRDVVLIEKDLELLREVRKLNPFGEYIFTSNGTRIKSTAFTNKLYRICDHLNIPRRSMHKCRKTYITNLIDAKVAPTIICKQVGHTDFNTSVQYYYRNNKTDAEIKETVRNARIV